MKKIVIILVVAIILCVVVVKVINHEVIDNTDVYNSITESIIGKTLPDGYTTIKAKETNSKGKIALLTSNNEHTVILVEGAPIKTEKKMISIIENKLKLFDTIPDSKATVKKTENLLVETNSLPRFNILIKNKEKQYKGIATFIHYKDKTVLFICLANDAVYNEAIAVDFLKNIKLPKEKELF